MTDTTGLHIEVVLVEDADHTEARANLTVSGARFTGFGRARRNPADPDVPMIGEELATARALSDLSHKLMEAAAAAISEREGRPAHLTT